MINKKSFYQNSVIILLADIPADMDDNDPVLIERMQSIFNRYFIHYRARYAGIPVEKRFMDGGEFTVPEIRDMKPDCIDELRMKLKSFDMMDVGLVHRIRLRRMLAFLDKMSKIPDDKPSKTFIQYITGIPDDNKPAFADAIRDEFMHERGMEIRYMIEALIDLGCMAKYENASELHRAIKNHFGDHIGTRQSIFGSARPKNEIHGRGSWKISIDNAIQRISPIIKRFI